MWQLLYTLLFPLSSMCIHELDSRLKWLPFYFQPLFTVHIGLYWQLFFIMNYDQRTYIQRGFQATDTYERKLYIVVQHVQVLNVLSGMGSFSNQSSVEHMTRHVFSLTDYIPVWTCIYFLLRLKLYLTFQTIKREIKLNPAHNFILTIVY